MNQHLENHLEMACDPLAEPIQQSCQRVSFSQICTALRNAPRILVVSHCRPDGDALGSTLAAAAWLEKEGHVVTRWNEDGLPEKFSYLPDSSLLTKPSQEPRDFDAVLILDTAAKKRMGEMVFSKARAPLWVAIDHHVSNEYFGNLNWIEPTAPATGQMLAEGFLSEGIAITPAMAANLYVAISTDTGSFQYHNTTARTLEIAALLVKCGVDIGALSQAMYGNQPRRRFELLKHALTHAQFSEDGRIASFSLTLHDATRLKISPDDTEGIIDSLRAIDEVVVAVFFEELSENAVRLSLRSKNNFFDASAFCQRYGGGGHHMAAGARISGDLRSVEKKILSDIAALLLAQRFRGL